VRTERRREWEGRRSLDTVNCTQTVRYNPLLEQQRLPCVGMDASERGVEHMRIQRRRHSGVLRVEARARLTQVRRRTSETWKTRLTVVELHGVGSVLRCWAFEGGGERGEDVPSVQVDVRRRERAGNGPWGRMWGE
jgi:hypothetical protein